MKYIPYILILLFSIVLSNCSSSDTRKTETEKQLTGRLPKVLYITTGVNHKDNDIDLPKGIIVAIQIFNKSGIPVRLEPRDVLFDKDFLFDYDIIILSTSLGYHDADRKYSLTYMTDAELKNLDDFVMKGGVLIAGDNIGRNYFDGTDRLGDANKLNKNNYPLTKTFGVVLEEKNMKGYHIEGNISDSLKGEFLSKVDEDLWTLVPDTIISKSLKSLAYWKNQKDSIPAIMQNDYGDGTAFLLSSSDFLDINPESDYWNINQLEIFYKYVTNHYFEKNNISCTLNPWPNGYSYAFCATFNSQGNIEQYKKIISGLNKYKIKPSFFVNGLSNDTVMNYLKGANVELASTGLKYENYENYDYPTAINDILSNEKKWNRKFKGFRFPFTNPEFSGLLAIDIHNYSYESSISVNNLEFLHGSVFPYNIIITHNKFYKSTNILEIAPLYHDDYFFLNELVDKKKINRKKIMEKTMIYSQYLNDFWNYSVKPYNGLMVYLGHPAITGYNDTTFLSLQNIIDTIRNDNTWLTSIGEIADFRNKYDKLDFYTGKSDTGINIAVRSDNDNIVKGISINLEKRPVKATANRGKVKILERNGKYSIVFDAFNGQNINISF